MESENKKLTVGFVMDDTLDSTDGVQQYILALGGWLSARGHEVHYLVGHTTRTDLPNIHSLSQNINTQFNRNIGTTPLPASSRKIKKLLNEVKFDVLHIQVPYSPLLGAKVIRRADADTAIIGTFHVLSYSGLVKRATKALGLILKPSIKRFDRMLAVSAAAQVYAKEVFGVDSIVLPNVVDYPRFHTAKPLEKYQDGKINIVFLGRLVPRKGCDVLLRAAKELVQKDDVPEFRVLVCGRGPMDTRLKQYVAENGLEDHVEFTGYLPEEDKPRYLASADIAVYPSSGGESFGIVLIEALSTGKSVVFAGDNAGYHSVMQGQPALLFEPKDVSELVEKLEHYMKSQVAREEMSLWGERYAKQFDIPTVAGQLLKIYKEALNHKR